MRRPDTLLRFAWTPAPGGAVEPAAAEEETGWTPGQRPPAQYFNALFNNSGQWLTWLSGPSLSRWSRVELPDSGLTPSGHPLSLAADNLTVEGDNIVHRLVAAGYDGSATCLYASRRGDDWTRYDNFPGGISGDITRVYFFKDSWYLLWDDGGTDGYLLWTRQDQYPGTALNPSNDWTHYNSLVPTSGLVALAEHDRGVGREQVLAAANQLYAGSISAGFSGPASLSVDPTVTGPAPDADSGTVRGSYTDVVFDGSYFVAISTHGDVVVATTAGGITTFAAVSRIAVTTDKTWRLTKGADGELVAWQRDSDLSGPMHWWRSLDHGTSWVETIPTAGPKIVYDLAYAEGLWVATALGSVWTSNDLATWVRARTPFIDGSNLLYAITLCEGAWVAFSGSHALVGGRAEDTTQQAWETDPTPPVLANAGWLASYRLSTTPPTDGQALLYVSSTGRWTPTTLPAAPTLPWSSAGAPATVQTTDATVTTLATIPTTTDKGLTLQVLVSATKGDRSAIVSWLYLVSVVNVGGTPSVVDALQLGCTDPAASHVDGTAPVAFDVSTTTIRVRVKGGAGVVDWSAARVSLLGN